MEEIVRRILEIVFTGSPRFHLQSFIQSCTVSAMFSSKCIENASVFRYLPELDRFKFHGESGNSTVLQNESEFAVSPESYLRLFVRLGKRHFEQLLEKVVIVLVEPPKIPATLLELSFSFSFFFG